MVYEVLKALHIVSVIAWMAGLLYLPRLYVYHADATPGSAQSETFKVMERRLLRGIMNPAMVAVWLFGLALAWQGEWWHAGWWQVKAGFAVGLTGIHHLYSRWRKDFAADRNTRPARYYRWWNEVPTLFMVVIVFLAVLKPSFAQAQAGPEELHLVPERLARMVPWYEEQIGQGIVTGVVVGIARPDKVEYLQAIGTQDRTRQVPMKTNSIFWAASMTKSVTSVAAMMLVEEGKLDLEAPVAKYLPELADMKIKGEAPHRPMQVIDLLRTTAGLTYPEEGPLPEHQLYGQAVFRRDHTLAEFVTSLGHLPLVYQPGEVWEYSWSFDVLGRVIEVVSGQTFDVFLQSRLFDPLGMVDTGFVVPPDKVDRLVDPPPGGRAAIWDLTKPTKLFSGGGGLSSTAPDYLRFCRMLLNGGTLDGKHYLAAEAIKRMASDQIPPGTPFEGDVAKWVGPKVGTSWGLGFEVRVNPDYSLRPGAVGTYGWSGYWGTYFWIDPVSRLAAVLMVQIKPEDSQGQYRDGLRHFTYAALSPTQPLLPAIAATPNPRDAGVYDFGASLSALDRRAPFPALSGVGILVAMQDAKPVVRAAFEGSPGFVGGVRAGDVIAAVDGTAVAGLPLEEMLEKIRGPADTPVRLRLIRAGQDAPIDLTLTRKPIRAPGARLAVRVAGDALTVEVVGPWPVLDFDKGKPVKLRAIAADDFQGESGEHTRVAFPPDKPDRVVLNPGPWQIEGQRIR